MTRTKKIVEEMNITDAKTLASLVTERELNEKQIIPGVFDKRCVKVVAEEVVKVAEELNFARYHGIRDW